MNKSWSPGISENIDYYVYRLIDPRDGATFYVGKGKGDRVFQHALDVDRISKVASNDEKKSMKVSRIKAIIKAGLQPLPIIHRHGLSNETAIEVEAALIDAYEDLSNIKSGHATMERGPMSVAQIERKYALPYLGDCSDCSLLLINVNHTEHDRGLERLYDQVRFCWRINISRARKADYVLAVIRGVVMGAYTVDEWKKATSKNFPEFGIDAPERWSFIGKRAADAAWNRFVGDYGKRISEEQMKHVQNPIKYWNL